MQSRSWVDGRQLLLLNTEFQNGIERLIGKLVTGLQQNFRGDPTAAQQHFVGHLAENESYHKRWYRKRCPSVECFTKSFCQSLVGGLDWRDDINRTADVISVYEETNNSHEISYTNPADVLFAAADNTT